MSNLERPRVIKVVGVGGSGGNAISTMKHFGLDGVEFITVNTDVQALGSNPAEHKIAIGAATTRGLGAGADPERGRRAAQEDEGRLKAAVTGADVVVVTAGMGGGTGTGAAPVIARLARETGALTIGIVSKPFAFEGRQRSRRADQGLAALVGEVDSLIVIPNEMLLRTAASDLTFVEAFRQSDEALYRAVRGVTELLAVDGVVHVDMDDLRMVLAGKGAGAMGTGRAEGAGRARVAAERAMGSPLLVAGFSLFKATGLVVHVLGGPDLKMGEIQEAASAVQEGGNAEANVVFGATVDEDMKGAIRVTVIATGGAVGDHVEQVVGEPSQTEPSSLDAPVATSDAKVADSLSLFFDLATIAPHKAGLVIRALEKVFGMELQIVRTRPLPPGKTGPRSSNDAQRDASSGL